MSLKGLSIFILDSVHFPILSRKKVQTSCMTRFINPTVYKGLSRKFNYWKNPVLICLEEFYIMRDKIRVLDYLQKWHVILLLLIGLSSHSLFGQITDVHELLDQVDFNDGAALPWHISEAEEHYSDFEVKDGEFILHLYEGGANKWDVQIRHRGLVIEQGHTYRVRFKVRATKATKVYFKIGSQGEPYNEYWNNNWSNFDLTPGEVTEVDETFTMDDPTDNVCEFAMHAGGPLLGSAPLDIILDDISLTDPEYIREDTPRREKPIIRVNQVGYLPNSKKIATIVHDSTNPLNWALKNGSGNSVLTGITTVYGNDEASDDHVHKVDFSSYTTTGTGYTLEMTDGSSSHPFDISDDIYSQMKYDAFNYFYHNRSGIDIILPYAIREDLTREAGHKPDIMATWPGTGQENYSLDVTKGWYDAGDHGKYVVNGGISVWTMMNQYERTLHIPGADKTAFEDGKGNIPESGNGIPDLLDESRWQMEMMLAMQVPEGKSYAGMVHHKGHDEVWTALGMEPKDDPETRYLRPVSTAATLNLAATAAQTARLWQEFDVDFANQNLIAAEKAWEAAMDNPTIYAPVHSTGGGPYNDSNVTDEFYWAACELYITTGKAVYKNFMENSEHYLEMPTQLTEGEDNGLTAVFTWGSTQGLGTLSLALVPGVLDSTDRNTIENNITTASDIFLTIMDDEGYHLPLQSTVNGYPWGSNSFIVNEMVVMAYAYDITQDQKYLDGITGSMDYLLGRNAMDQSYVSGYGEIPLENPHHRFWAKQANPDFPSAPAGALSGGPNSGLEDPWVQGAGMAGTAPQKCFMDHIESWSTNEITINWNAPFTWITSFLDENRGPQSLSISITDPDNGEQIRTGDILINTTTSGVIDSVSFYSNSSYLGTDNSAPYQYNWVNVSTGTYSLKAIADGTAGDSTESSVISIEVIDNLVPEVSITSPANGAIFGLTDSITITADASDADGTVDYVQFLVDGNSYSNDYSAPYSISPSGLSAGDHTISAVAVDNEGKESVAVSITITLQDAILIKPEVSITTPTNGKEFLQNETINITANASDADGTVTKVEFFVGDTKIGQDSDAPYNASWSSNTLGSYNITAKAIDNDNQSTISAQIPITIKEDSGGGETDIKLQSYGIETGDSSKKIKGYINIINSGTTDISLTDVKVRYYYTQEVNVIQKFNCYYALIGKTNVKGEIKTESGQNFVEITFTSGSVPAGENSGKIQYQVANADWSYYDQTNDYSFIPNTSFVDNSSITVYHNNTLVWGNEPN